jgi:hypothetical protein
MAFFRPIGNFLDPLCGGGSLAGYTVSEEFDFVCDDIEGVEAGEDGKVVLIDACNFIIGVVNHV